MSKRHALIVAPVIPEIGQRTDADLMETALRKHRFEAQNIVRLEEDATRENIIERSAR